MSIKWAPVLEAGVAIVEGTKRSKQAWGGNGDGVSAATNY